MINIFTASDTVLDSRRWCFIVILGVGWFIWESRNSSSAPCLWCSRCAAPGNSILHASPSERVAFYISTQNELSRYGARAHRIKSSGVRDGERPQGSCGTERHTGRGGQRAEGVKHIVRIFILSVCPSESDDAIPFHPRPLAYLKRTLQDFENNKRASSCHESVHWES